MVRERQLALVIKKELSGAPMGKPGKKRFPLGLVNVETDLEIVQLCKEVYTGGSLGLLDGLLGTAWDVALYMDHQIWTNICTMFASYVY